MTLKSGFTPLLYMADLTNSITSIWWHIPGIIIYWDQMKTHHLFNLKFWRDRVSWKVICGTMVVWKFTDTRKLSPIITTLLYSETWAQGVKLKCQQRVYWPLVATHAMQRWRIEELPLWGHSPFSQQCYFQLILGASVVHYVRGVSYCPSSSRVTQRYRDHHLR